MTLDVREPTRERPAPLSLGTSLGEKKHGLRVEMKKEDQLKTEKSRNGWNIPSCGGGEEREDKGLEALMSRLSLATAPDGEVPCRQLQQLLRAALARADTQQLERLREAASKKATAQFLQQLYALLGKTSAEGEKQKKSNTDCSKQDGQPQVTATGAQKSAESKPLEGKDKLIAKKKDLLRELKDGDDLCPRSPMRQQHNHRNTFPYQNTSRIHHSGGYMSTVVYSDPVAPTPQYQNHLDTLSCIASSPPVNHVAEQLSDYETLTDQDKDLLMDMVEKYLVSPFQKSVCENNETDYIPAPISELNSSTQTNTFKHVDHRVPTNYPDEQSIIQDVLLSSSPSNQDSAWGGGDCSDESGCYSLSPASILSSSPGGGSHLPLSPDSGHHVVPDISGEVSTLVPSNMSPSGHFFDDNCPYATSYNINVNITAKEAGNFKDNYAVSPAEYSYLSTPSPTTSPTLQPSPEYSYLGTPSPTLQPSPEYSYLGTSSPTLQQPSNNLQSQVCHDFDTNLQLGSDNISYHPHEDFDPNDLLLKLQNESPTQLNDFSHDFVPATTYAQSDPSSYSANIPASTTSSQNLEQLDGCFQFSEHSTVRSAQNVLNFECAAKNVNNVEFYERSTFAQPNFAVNNAHTYVDSTPSTVNANNVQLGVLLPVMHAKLVSPAPPTLKQLKPKVEHFLRPESGRDRILQMMDKEKKAQAWVKVSANLKKMNTKDEDGDTQLMILCTNTNGSDSCVLEYTYALVEMLKKMPNALAAVNNQNQSALYLAALYSNHAHRAVVVRYIAETLVELGEDINYTSETGNSMLHEICQQGDQRYDVLVELLSLKNKDGRCYFNVNHYNHEGKTPLLLAASCHGVNGVSCLKTVRLLIAEGADVTLPERSHSNTVLHLAVGQSCAPNLMEALLSGSPAKNELVCRMINNNRDSPLHSAASRNDVPLDQQMRVIRVLLRHGAVKSLNTAGKFPIALVAEERRQEIKRVYEKKEAKQRELW